METGAKAQQRPGSTGRCLQLKRQGSLSGPLRSAPRLQLQCSRMPRIRQAAPCSRKGECERCCLRTARGDAYPRARLPSFSHHSPSLKAVPLGSW